jgi:hypothetical protein
MKSWTRSFLVAAISLSSAIYAVNTDDQHQ